MSKVIQNEIQKIGIDVGRGYTKGYTEFNSVSKECLFKSIAGEGRNIDFSEYEEPIFINYDNEEWFVGLLAEKESHNIMRNIKEEKTTLVVEVLIAAALSKLAISDEVQIMLGVPKDSFRKSVLNEIKEKYKDNEFKVKDLINGGVKTVKIIDISIFREADSALYWELRESKTIDKPVGIASVGFRTTELSYFDKGLKFNDKKSESKELGNKSAMNTVREKLIAKDIKKEINEIDTSNDYDELKEKAYRITAENIEQAIEETWGNLNEMDVYIAGGTSLKMKFDESFKKVQEPQMATAKGLYLLATKTFK